jgi:hypothetical protein
MDRTETALGKFNEGYNCAQSAAFAFEYWELLWK